MQNLVTSIKAYYPEFNMTIFDDGSDDENTLQVLSTLKRDGITVLQGNNSSESKHGGLYRQMNKALQYALQHSYAYAYFVQDDMQYLWRDNLLEAKVAHAFSQPECIMCNSSFLQKILTEGIESRLPALKPGLYSFTPNGVADTGIIDLEKAQAIGLSFPQHSEHSNGRYWYEKGYRLYWLPVPHLAWVPWPTTIRNKIKQIRTPYVLKPLGQKTIEKLQKNTSYAYLEDYTSIDNGYMIKPYWYTANPGKLSLLKIYIKYYFRTLIRLWQG